MNKMIENEMNSMEFRSSFLTGAGSSRPSSPV